MRGLAHIPSNKKFFLVSEDVGNTAAFLCSDLAAGITGEVVYVDGGYSSVGMSFSDGT